jgi:uncharacterized protein YdeI (YjbR/CyaY-like superfamily)
VSAAAADLQIIPFASRELLSQWLAEHHDGARGIWLKIAKRASGIPTVTYAEAVEVVLCHGWIDGQRRAFDDRFFLQRLTPRTRTSRWSEVNCGKVLGLIEAGEMTPAGLRQIERARADGRWEAAYAPMSSATVPDDLRAALDAEPGAAAFFERLDSRNRYAILYRVQDAKRPETRAGRIARYAAMCGRGEVIYP